MLKLLLPCLFVHNIIFRRASDEQIQIHRYKHSYRYIEIQIQIQTQTRIHKEIQIQTQIQLSKKMPLAASMSVRAQNYSPAVVYERTTCSDLETEPKTLT